MQRHSTRKQTPTLLNLHSSALDTRFPLLKKTSPMTTSGILFVGLAATAGISSVAFALQHDSPSPFVVSTSDFSHNSSSDGTVQSVNETSVDATVTNSTDVTSDDTSSVAPSNASVSGEATINNEVIPLTEGTIHRSYSDSDGSQNSVTITIDGSTSVVNDTDSRTHIQVYSNSSSTTSENTTRGSPRR